MNIRLAVAADFAAMQEIEVEAGARFASIGMQLVADDDPFSSDELADFAARGSAWVAIEGQQPVGYLVALIVDGRAHIEQVSVRPAHGRHGIGRALVGRAVTWASEAGLHAVTLTTFVDVPWNMPLYERLGFRRMAPSEISPGLAAIIARESAHGLDRWPRVAMIRTLTLDHAPDMGKSASKARR